MLSIITPVLNGERFIRKNIESIHNLTIPHEHIVVEGGSSDSTIEILKDYPYLTVINQNERNGMYGAIAQGFSEARGDLIALDVANFAVFGIAAIFGVGIGVVVDRRAVNK